MIDSRDVLLVALGGAAVFMLGAKMRKAGLRRRALALTQGETSTMQWNPAVLDKFIAPGISGFTTAAIPDLREKYPHAPHWLGNHFLNSVLRGSFKDGWRQTVLAFIRRTHNAFSAYHKARERTATYLDGISPNNPKIGQYFDAISSWEEFCLQVNMALDRFKWLNLGQGAFAENDGSKDQRIYDIANQVKHSSRSVDAEKAIASSTIPLWLTNTGICSTGIDVTYEEASQVLSELCAIADELQDPRSIRKAEKEHS